MQVIRVLFFAMMALISSLSYAQVEQARGKATITYEGWSVSEADRQAAVLKAQLRAIETYFAEHGEAYTESLEAVSDQIAADIDNYILETTVLSEEDMRNKNQFSTTVRVSINVAKLRNLMKSNSAVANVDRGSRSPLAFVMVSRQQDTVRDYQNREYRRVDETGSVRSSGTRTDNGSSSESIRRGSVNTGETRTQTYSGDVSRSASIETGGSTLRQSSDATWRLLPSANLNQVFTSVFSKSGYKVNEAAMIEPYTGGAFTVAELENDYKSGNDLKPATLANVVRGMRNAQIPYIALGTLDVAIADKDPATGMMRVGVTVNAKVLDVTETIPETIASVGPIVYAGVGATEDEARAIALSNAADEASRELTRQMANIQVR